LYTDATSLLTYNDGRWHHAAGVLRNGLAELYVDGVLVAQDTTNPIASVRSSTRTVAGRVASDFVGGIDEMRLYSRALSPEEISSLGATGLVLPGARIDNDPYFSIQVEVSLVSTVNHTWYAGWIDYRLGPDGCACAWPSEHQRSLQGYAPRLVLLESGTARD